MGSSPYRSLFLLWALISLALAALVTGVSHSLLPKPEHEFLPSQLGQVPQQMAVSADEKSLVTWSWPDGLVIWDIKTLKRRKTINPSRFSNAPIFCQAAGKVITSNQYFDAQLRDFTNGLGIQVFPKIGKTSAVSADGRVLAGLFIDTLRIYDVRSGRLLWSVPNMPDQSDLRFSPNGKWLALAFYDPTKPHPVRVWNVATGSLQSVSDGWAANRCKYNPVSLESNRLDASGPVVFSPDGKTYATTGVDPLYVVPEGEWRDEGAPVTSDVKIWSTASGRLLRVIKGWTAHLDMYKPLAFSPNGRVLACGSTHHFDLISLDSGSKLLSTDCSATPVFSADASVVAFESIEEGKHRIHLYSMLDGLPFKTISSFYTSIALSFHGDEVFEVGSGEFSVSRRKVPAKFKSPKHKTTLGP